MNKYRKVINHLAIILLCASLFILFSYFKAVNFKERRLAKKGMQNFLQQGVIYNPEVDEYIEEDYFGNNTFKNGDFSHGLSHFAIHTSKNIFAIDQNEYVSPGQSLKITTIESPSRIYYSKQKKFTVFEYLPWYFRNNSTWLGVSSPKTVFVSFYYKGAGPTAYINLLEKSGAGRVLFQKELAEKNKNWEKVELSASIPEQARALQIEITLNSVNPNVVTYIDDINLYVTNNKSK